MGERGSKSKERRVSKIARDEAGRGEDVEGALRLRVQGCHPRRGSEEGPGLSGYLWHWRS